MFHLRLLGVLGAALVMVACAANAVQGVVEGGDESFVGASLLEIDGGGALSVWSNRGAVCAGNFVYVRPREGRGTFRCTDGRVGPFQFVSTGLRGTGTGHFGGKRFVFSFG